jgi:hypothetical protein
LIEQFEQEHQAQIAEAERRRVLLEARQHTQAPAPMPPRQQAQHSPPRAPPLIPTSAQRAEAEIQARRTLGEQFPGVNLDLPGFKGLLRMEVDKILRTNAAFQETLPK